MAETLTVTDAVRWIVQQIRCVQRNRTMDTHRLEAKVTSRLRIEWNLEPDASKIQKSIDAALAA
ncbi:MAG: hypothetical protein ABJL55_18140 [Roseibium sp.]